MTDDHQHNLHWTPELIARLGYLCGLGWDGEAIAISIGTSPSNIYRQLSIYGISIRAKGATAAIELPSAASKFYTIAGKSRGLTRDAMIQKLLLEVADDPFLLDNILDDKK